MPSKIFIAITALIGTIIGAGFLGVPYVVMLSGFPIGFAHLLVIGIITAITMLYMGEIALRTKTNHQLTGYAEKYLGKKGKVLMFLSVAFGLYSAILAYLIGEGESLSFLFFNNLNHTLYFGIALWFIISTAAYFGIKALEEGDLLGVSAVFLLIILIAILFASKIDTSNLQYTNINNFFAPFGVILFSYIAFSIVPEIKNILNKEKAKIKPAIIFSYLIAFIIYSIFTTIVLGFKGSLTPEIATLVLGKPFIVLGIVTMFTSYLSLSIALIDTFKFDFKMKRSSSWLLTISIPLVLFIILILTNNIGFTKIIGIGGAISGGLAGILILIMAKKAKIEGDRKPEYSIPFSSLLAIIISLIFIIGAAAEIINIIK